MTIISSYRVVMIRLYILFCLLHFRGLIEAACDSGWFGEKCQFLCHCDRDVQCDSNGRCSNKCALGWFGLQCQYQDMALISQVTVTTTPSNRSTSWMKDNNDDTCNIDQSLQALNFTWRKPHPFTWLRLKVKDPILKTQFNLIFLNANGQILNCYPLISILDITTVDYSCDFNDTVRQILIFGSGVKSLCTLYVSGGRDVALRQTALQSSALRKHDGNLAVDGNADLIFFNNTCTHANHTIPDKNQSWNLTLDHPRSVQRFFLYNREKIVKPEEPNVNARQQNFIIEALDVNNNIVWSYQDMEVAEVIYAVTGGRKITLSKIRIIPSNKPFLDRKFIRVLCKVQIYGDCVSGTWGLDCSKTCPPVCETTCHQETGLCPTIIDNKTFCPDMFWGSNCTSPCNSHCLNGLCDAQTGICSIGCEDGYKLPDCLQTPENDIEYKGSWRNIFGTGFAVVVFSLLAVQAVVFVIVVLRRRRSNQKQFKPNFFNRRDILNEGNHDYQATCRLEKKDDLQNVTTGET